MSANYLHGVETVILDKGPRPIRAIKSSVIFLVGVAPVETSGQIALITNETEAAALGKMVPGFNIPHALDAIFAQGGAGPVVVVNVFDKSSHTEAVANEAVTVEGRKFRTIYPTITDVVVTNSAGTTTYVNGTDYTWDQFGDFVIPVGSAITEGQSLLVDYSRFDNTNVTASHIIGTITSGVRSGLQLIDEVFNRWGFNPKIIIAPKFDALTGVAAEMIEKAEKVRGHCIIDQAEGVLPSAAITARGNVSGIYASANKRVIYTYPYVMAYEPYFNAAQSRPMSQYLAGVMASVDLNEGYWVSPSNHEIKGITGVERTITWAINDASTEANLLNEAGYVTVAAGFGTGVRVWGNRSAAWPTSTAPSNFIPVQRVADILHESVELAMLQFIDKPINNAVISSIKESVNAFIRTLVQRGAIVDGECTYDPNNNPAVELAAGHLTFDLTFMPPTPAERITFQSFIDINLLSNLGA
jgi:hypothetical protein